MKVPGGHIFALKNYHVVNPNSFLTLVFVAPVPSTAALVVRTTGSYRCRISNERRIAGTKLTVT